MLGRGLESLIPPLNKNLQIEGEEQKPTPAAPEGKFSNISDRIKNLTNHPAVEPNTPAQKDYSAEALFVNAPEPTPRPKSGHQDSTPIFQIEIEKIKPNPYQPRREFEEASMKELAESIREYGILQPLIVTKKERETDLGTQIEYQLVAGERRFLAAKMLGFHTIPAIVKTETPERAKLEIAIIENLQREDLNPVEAARAFARLQDEFRLTQREIAARIGKSREAIANAVRLLSLPSEVQIALEKGKITEGHARVILAVDNLLKQQEILNQIVANSLSVRETEKLARGETIVSHSRVLLSSVKNDAESQFLRNQLEEALGAKVNLIQRGEKGKITINFFSPEELKGIVQKILGTTDDL